MSVSRCSLCGSKVCFEKLCKKRNCSYHRDCNENNNSNMCECCYQKALPYTSIDNETFDKLFNNHNLDFITTKKTCK